MLYTRRVIAVLYDVHGNLAALDAVLEDARAAGAQRWLLGGDYALFGGWPAESVARLRELQPAVWVRGNVDRWTGDATADELGRLPFEAEVAGARVVHASPVSDLRSFGPGPGEDDAELLEGVTAARLLFGHTHVQFRRTAGEVELVNPGSVGYPLDGDRRAAYALLDPEGGQLELRRV